MKTRATTQTAVMTRRAALALALASAVPLAGGERVRHAAAEPVLNTWMYAGNPARTGSFPGLGLDFTRDIAELWRIDGRQTGIIVNPCGVCDGIVYYIPVPHGVSPEVQPLVAVDVQTGAELWRHDPPVTDPPTFFFGQPAVADGLLVMPTYSGLLVGLDARSGEERWIFDLQEQTADCRPAIVDGVVYISDRVSVNAVKVGAAAEWLWKSPLGDGTTTVVSGTVSVDGESIVVSSVTPIPDSNLDEKSTDIHVLNVADGAESYRYQFRSVGESYQFAVRNKMLYSRVDNAYLQRSHIFSMFIDGREQWSFRTSDVYVYPAVNGELVYGVAGDAVWGHDATTGQRVWNSPRLQTLNSDIVLIDGVIYIGAAPPTPMIYALSAADGTLLRSITVPFEGAQVVGITNGVLIARSGLNMVALANLP